MCVSGRGMFDGEGALLCLCTHKDNGCCTTFVNSTRAHWRKTLNFSNASAFARVIIILLLLCTTWSDGNSYNHNRSHPGVKHRYLTPVVLHARAVTLRRKHHPNGSAGFGQWSHLFVVAVRTTTTLVL